MKKLFVFLIAAFGFVAVHAQTRHDEGRRGTETYNHHTATYRSHGNYNAYGEHRRTTTYTRHPKVYRHRHYWYDKHHRVHYY